ncbi:MAG: sugar transferase [Oscillospiraceae bacterium]
MKNKEQFKRIFVFFDALLLVAAVAVLFSIIWYTQYNSIIKNSFWRNGNILLVFIYIFVYITFARSFSGFKIGYFKTGGAIGSQLLSLLFTHFVTYFQISLIGRKMLPLGPLVFLTVIDLGVVAVWAFLSNRIYARIYPPRRMIIVYGNPSARDLAEKMSLRMDKYLICSSVSIEEGIDAVKAKITEYEAVIICDVPAHVRNLILKFTFARSIRTYIDPKLSDIIIRGADDFHMFDTPLMLSRNQGLAFEQKFLKRATDILLSAVMLLILSPVLVIFAAIIKLYDRGPVFYSQERLTLDSARFHVLKFRSMIVNAEKDGVARLASRGDSRITPVGKFIRKTRIDELPQLINILRGEMSFVGPRPERPEIADKYEEIIPEFRFRLKVKAGLTGYAQVMGKYNTTPYDKLKLDLMYIEKQSLFLDLKIMLMTLRTVFVPDATEGIDKNAIDAVKQYAHAEEAAEEPVEVFSATTD